MNDGQYCRKKQYINITRGGETFISKDTHGTFLDAHHQVCKSLRSFLSCCSWQAFSHYWNIIHPYCSGWGNKVLNLFEITLVHGLLHSPLYAVKLLCIFKRNIFNIVSLVVKVVFCFGKSQFWQPWFWFHLTTCFSSIPSHQSQLFEYSLATIWPKDNHDLLCLLSRLVPNYIAGKSWGTVSCGFLLGSLCPNLYQA